jgi:hypothetical protein
LRRHHGAAATSEARRFLLTSQTVWAAEGVFIGMIRTSNEEVAEPSTILLTHLRNFLRVTFRASNSLGGVGCISITFPKAFCLLILGLSLSTPALAQSQTASANSLNSKLTAEVRRDKPDSARVTELKAELQEARLEYEDFETRLHLAHPKLKAQRADAPVIKAEEIVALLPDASSAVLEYVVGEKQTYLFVATKTTDVRVYTLPVKRDELVKQTEDFRQQLARRDLGFRASAAKLYEILLKPAEGQLRGKTNLIIAPDHTLWDLPFQALMRRRCIHILRLRKVVQVKTG